MVIWFSVLICIKSTRSERASCAFFNDPRYLDTLDLIENVHL